MPQLIPFNNEGSRVIDVTLGDNVFKIRTYYLPYIKRWIMDIMGPSENPIISGICLNVGVGNLVKGKASIFDGQTIRCLSIDGTENDTPESLGTTCVVVYYGKGEEAPSLYVDKMLD